MSEHQNMVPRPGAFGRWIITKIGAPDLAWTGSRWTQHQNGIPLAKFQVSNFADECEAHIYIYKLARQAQSERSEAD